MKGIFSDIANTDHTLILGLFWLIFQKITLKRTPFQLMKTVRFD